MPSSTDFHMIAPELVAGLWDTVEPFIKKACADGKNEPQDYLDTLSEGRQQLWLSGRNGTPVMVLVTEIRDYPRKRVAALVVCIGEGREDWLSHLTTVEGWAKGQGCKALLAEARPGWERVLGWKKTHVVLEREI